MIRLLVGSPELAFPPSSPLTEVLSSPPQSGPLVCCSLGISTSTTFLPGWLQLVPSPAFGSPGSSFCSQGGYRFICLQGCVRCSPHHSWYSFCQLCCLLNLCLCMRCQSSYLVLIQQTKFFRLQLGDRTDVVDVDSLKPAFSANTKSPAVLPLGGHLVLCPPVSAVSTPAYYFPPFAMVTDPVLWKSFRLQLLSALPVKWNPHWAACCRMILPPFLRCSSSGGPRQWT